MQEHDYLWKSVTKDFILDDLDEAVCVVDNNGVVTVWNKKSEQIYDLPKGEILGKPIDDVLSGTVVMDVLRTGEDKQNIYKATRTGCSILVKAKVIYKDGERIGVMCVDKDLSEIDELKNHVDKLYDRITYLESRSSSDPASMMIGNSEQIEELMRRVHKVSKSDASIFINGESGVGKKSLARQIHTLSGREGMFVDVNCGAVPLDMFEEEFCGMQTESGGTAGLFELAEGGTLYFEEITDMSLKMQSQLLNALQKRQFNRVGSKEVQTFHSRIIAATTKNAYELVEKGEFLEDLYYRLNVISLDVPPLRDRGSDITLLSELFLKELADKYSIKVPAISPKVRNILLEYEWKGNLRELKNILEHMIVMSGGKEITEDMVPYSVRDSVSKFARSYAQVNDLTKNVSEYEKHIIEEVLENTDWNKSLAARMLNIPRTTLMYKIQIYDLKDNRLKKSNRH